MGKKIIMLIGAILIIISAGIIANMLAKNKDDGTSLPHYKQAFIKFKGSVNFLANEKNKFDLIFADEEKFSEYSEEYIKNMNIVDLQNNKYPLENWTIIFGESRKHYTLKKIESEITVSGTGTIIVSALEVTFTDDKTEKYELGNLRINTYTAKDYAEILCPGFFNTRLIYSSAFSHEDNFPVTGLLFLLNSYNKKYIIQSIELDIPEIWPDTENLNSFPEEKPFIIDEARENEEEWVKKFDSISRFTGLPSSKAINLEIGNEDSLNTYTTICVPISVLDSSNISEYIISFNPVIKCIYEGETKYLFAPSPVIYNPIYNEKFDLRKYLKEVGI